MGKNEVLEIIIRIIEDWYSDDRVTKNTVLGDDILMDSLDMIEFVMHLEKEFGIAIPDEDIDSFNSKSLSDIADYVLSKIN